MVKEVPNRVVDAVVEVEGDDFGDRGEMDGRWSGMERVVAYFAEIIPCLVFLEHELQFSILICRINFLISIIFFCSRNPAKCSSRLRAYLAENVGMGDDGVVVTLVSS